MLTKLSINEKRALFIFALLITSDIILFLLHSSGYYLVQYLNPSGFYVLLYNIMLICVFLILIKEGFLIILISPFLVIVLGIGLYFFSFMGWKYEVITSPKHTEKVVVKYTGAKLDHNNETYRFYQITFMGLLMKKLEIRDNFSDIYNIYEGVHELDNPKWMNEKKLIFRTKQGDKRVMLK